MLGNFHDFLSSADFFQKQRFQNYLSGKASECKTVRVQHIASLFWNQTVCKDYQQTTPACEELTCISPFRLRSAENGILDILLPRAMTIQRRKHKQRRKHDHRTTR